MEKVQDLKFKLDVLNSKESLLKNTSRQFLWWTRSFLSIFPSLHEIKTRSPDFSKQNKNFLSILIKVLFLEFKFSYQ